MQITAEQDTPILELLAILAPTSSKTTHRSWVKEGRVTVDGQVIRQTNVTIAKGQKVSLGSKKQFIKGDIEVLYEDKHLVVINKPFGMLSVATAFEKTETAHSILKHHYHPRKIFVVHRIDQDTSGVMLFAFSEEAYLKLKETFEKHEIERAYCAIVEGQMTSLSGTWQSYLYEDRTYFVHETDDPTLGQIAITHYQVVKSNPRYTRLELKLETGRKNQIRVHCSSDGHPIVGDVKYGAELDPIKRLALHAQLLAFKHPITDKQMSFSSPVPESFQRLVREEK